MHDAVAVAVQQREGEGLCDGSGRGFGDQPSLLCAVKEVATVAQVHDDVDALRAMNNEMET